jgi:hypothetical protein
MSEPEVGVGRTIIPGQGERWSVTRGVYQLGPDVDNSRAKFNIIAHTSPYTYPSDLALSKQEGTRIVSYFETVIPEIFPDGRIFLVNCEYTNKNASLLDVSLS